VSYTIALAGKGGTGKTTTAALVIRSLLKRGLRPVLAVDADANANLAESLGIQVKETIGQVLAEFNESKISIPPGLTKGSYLEIRLNGTVAESRDIDLISMGRAEGSGCYCYPNTVLRKFIDELLPNYPFMVMDNEAGLEHLSRGTTERIDHLIVTSNHSIKGVRTVVRILQLVDELGLDIRNRSVIVTQAPGELQPAVTGELASSGIKLLTAIPQDRQIEQFDLEGKPLLELPGSSPAVMAVEAVMEVLLNNNDMASTGRKTDDGQNN